MTRSLLCCLLLLVATTGAFPQGRLTYALELVVGANAFPPPDLGEETITDGRRVGIGYQVGIAGILYAPKESWSFSLSTLYASERNDIDRVETSSPLGFSTGDLSARERRLRFALLARARLIPRVHMGFGMAVSHLLSAEHRYGLTVTTDALPDPVTGAVTPLPEPFVNRETRLLYQGDGVSYVSFPFSLGYELAPRWQLRLEADLSIRNLFSSNTASYRFSGARYLINLHYRLLSGRKALPPTHATPGPP